MVGCAVLRRSAGGVKDEGWWATTQAMCALGYYDAGGGGGGGGGGRGWGGGRGTVAVAVAVAGERAAEERQTEWARWRKYM